MRRPLAMLAALALLLAVAPPAVLAAAPANDNLSDAITISGASGSVAGTTVDATYEAGESFWWPANGSSVWFKWTYSGRRDPAVATFTAGDCGTQLHASSPAPAGPPDWYPHNVIASSYAAGCVDHVTMRFLATVGTTYWIRVAASTAGVQGPFTMAWSTASPVRASLSILLANVRGDPTVCTITVKGVNLLPEQRFSVRASDGERSVEWVDFTTAAKRWTPDPVPVTRANWYVGSPYQVVVDPGRVSGSDGVTRVTPEITNRCE